ncbi:phosphoribosylpyrophosphate synthetase [Marivirga salinae]|uniref:Phosphoribosylpyrophosphate synthetase n=1 Tax=Marivirga salinarum TaxID=3059078 RepID=A0AA49GA83_9BACT|nr:phosphoribosylpyrophosphate synthetase [Marivirga sp. BDSF4-3]WKK73798.1 phosphoribosylpyrophosphate synthetase [Marivirga sp. BDSF4-3]
MDSMNTVGEKIEELKKQGYTEDFFFEDGKLKTEEDSFERKDITEIEEYRFEGKSNPDDLSILYRISTSSGKKGTIADGYGPSANQELTEFILQAES